MIYLFIVCLYVEYHSGVLLPLSFTESGREFGWVNKVWDVILANEPEASGNENKAGDTTSVNELGISGNENKGATQ